MKAASIPPIRVEPQFRREVESVLRSGETLSEYVENAIRESVLKRQSQTEFVIRGMAAIAQTQRDASGIPAQQVLDKLQAKLDAAKSKKAPIR